MVDRAGTDSYHWQALGASVRGAAHIRVDKPNQDALRWWPRSGEGPPLILAVADGHGGERYARSHVGAKYAVRTAVQVLAREVLGLLHRDGKDQDLAHFKRTCEEWLPKVLVRRWREQVERHAHRYPLTAAERNVAESNVDRNGGTGEEATSAVVRLYGATLLAVLIADSFHLYVQIGDGDMLTVTVSGQVFRPPLPTDSRLLGNETTSLCMAEAWRSVRLFFQPLAGPPPALILLATDGYANSFVDVDGFEQVGVDLFRTLQSDGPETIAMHLPSWLQDTSTSGSGDDITVALAVCERARRDPEHA